MALTSEAVSDMLNDLEEEDYRTVISFIEFLASSRKKKKTEESKKTLAEIQKMFHLCGWNYGNEPIISGLHSFRPF